MTRKRKKIIKSKLSSEEKSIESSLDKSQKVINTLTIIEKVFEIYNKIPIEVKLVLWEISKVIYESLKQIDYSDYSFETDDARKSEKVDNDFKTDELKNELIDKLFEDAYWIKGINYFELEEALLEEDRYSEDFRGFIYFMRHVTNTLMIK